jgi:hypothetical protein
VVSSTQNVFYGTPRNRPLLIGIMVAVLLIGEWPVYTGATDRFSAFPAWPNVALVLVGAWMIGWVLLCLRQPYLHSVGVDDVGMSIRRRAETLELPWEEVLEARSEEYNKVLMRLRLSDGRTVSLYLGDLRRRDLEALRALVNQHAGERTRQAIEGELRDGAPLTFPLLAKAGHMLLPTFFVVQFILSAIFFSRALHLSLQRMLTERVYLWAAVTLACGPAFFLGCTLWVVRSQFRTVRFTSGGLEERWLWGRREVRMGEIQRVVLRSRGGLRLAPQTMAIHAPGQRIIVDAYMSRYEGVLGLLRRLAPQAEVVDRRP